MPGLLRGVARTAVIAGTATSVSNRVSRRQANRWAGQEEQQQRNSSSNMPSLPCSCSCAGPGRARRRTR